MATLQQLSQDIFYLKDYLSAQAFLLQNSIQNKII